MVSFEQEGVAAGTAISALSDFSAIKELDKITKEIEELGRLVYKYFVDLLIIICRIAPTLLVKIYQHSEQFRCC